MKESRLNNYLLPKLGSFPVEQISAPLVIDILKPLELANKLSLLRKVIELIKQVMTFAKNYGYVNNDCTSDIHRVFPKPKSSNVPSIDPEDIGEFMTRMSTANMQLPTRALFYWLMHTLVRSSEAATARWIDIDLDDAIWTIPAEYMKMKHDHKVPLTTQALSILETMRPFQDSTGYIFVSRRNKAGHIDSESINKAINKNGYAGKMCTHGIRSLASTTLNGVYAEADNSKTTFDSKYIELCLSHEVKGFVEQAYNKAEYIPQRRAIMDWWSVHVESVTPIKLTLENYSHR